MSRSDASEVDLVKQAARGDSRAFTALFERYFQSVYNYALSMCGDPAQAEDLTQEAFIRAHENLSKLGPPWNFRPWIFRMTRNLFIDLTRRSHPAQSLDESLPMPAPGPSPESRAVIREVAVRVRETLGELSEKNKEALVLRELHGLSYAEMAEVLDTTPAYVKTLLHRSRSQFQKAYGIRLFVEEPTEDCPEVAQLLHTLHDSEDLQDREDFVREHLQTCDACQERQRWLVTQSGLLAALAPTMPPAGLAERILRKAGLEIAAKPKRGLESLSKPLLYGGGLVVVVTLGWLAFSGLGGGRDPAPTATLEGLNALPSSTPAPEGSVSAPIIAEETPTPVSTVLLSEAEPRTNKDTLCWDGPGADYPLVLALDEDTPVTLAGIAQSGSWLIVEAPDDPDTTCWLDAGDVDVDPGFDFGSLTTYAVPPPPQQPGNGNGGQQPAGPPAAPTGLQANTTQCNGSYDVTISWNDNANNEQGFRVYRKGPLQNDTYQLIATLGPNAPSYIDNPAFGGPYSYYVVAFNQAGSSQSNINSDSGCLP